MTLHIVFFVLYLLCDNVFYLSPSGMATLVIIHCSIALIGVAKKGVRYVTPLNVIYVSVIVTSIANIMVEAKIGSRENRMNAYMIPKYLPEAATIWALGVCSIFLGYTFMGNRSFPSLRLDMSKENTIKLFRFILFVSLFTNQLIPILYFLGSVVKFIFLFGIIGILFYARLWTAENNNRYRNYALILFVIQTYNALMYSFLREELILPTVVLFAGYFIGKGNLKHMFTYRIIPFAILIYAFTLVFGALGRFRGSYSMNFANIISREYLEDNEKFGENDVFEEEEYRGTFMDRSAVVAQLTNVVKLVKDHGYYDGQVSAPLVVALVPRFLWPDKPLIVIGMWFAASIGQAQTLKGGLSTNSINLTVPGECFIDFGWPGLVIGCMLFGCLLALLWNSFEFYANGYNLIGILVGGYLLTISFGIAPDLQVIITYISTYIMFFFIRKIIVDYIL